MSRSYKWIGGIGYILALIPYANVVSSILIAIAWIMMGRDTREKVFTITGIFTLILFALTLGLMGVLISAMPSLMMLQGLSGSSLLKPFQVLGGLLTVLFAVIAIAVGVGIAAFVLEIISHFKAAKIFDNNWFKLGGWFRIGIAIALAISIPLVIASISSLALTAPSPGPAVLGLLLSVLWPIIIVVIVAFLSTIFSIIAFFTMPEEPMEAAEPEEQF